MNGLGWRDNPRNVKRMAWREARRVGLKIIVALVVLAAACAIVFTAVQR